MATVKFTDVGEFLAELKLDAGDVARNILRVTNRWRRLEPYPMQSLTVIACYRTCEDLVIVEASCGSFMSGLAEEQQARGRMEFLRDAIDGAAKELGLEVRAGVFE